MYDLRRLRAFHAVAERRSFSDAALALGYAQSVVSHHVAALEQEFGLTLIDRATRPVRPTEAGERLQEHAALVLGQVATAEEELRAFAGLLTGTVRVGAFLTACTSFVPPALARFEASHPDVKIELEQLPPAQALRRLRAGDLDVAVTWDVFGAAEDDGFERLLLGDDPYRIVLPAGHRLARRRKLRVEDLAGERFTGPAVDPGGRYARMLDTVFGTAGFAPDITYLVDDVSVGRAFVAAGVCVSVMPQLAVPAPRPDVVLRPIPGLDPARSVHAVWLRGRRVPAIPAMTRELARAAQSRLEGPPR
jgi:DNA-binding transcriptional LysR family regulator